MSPGRYQRDAQGREQVTARILQQAARSADCDFNQASLHPADPIKCRVSTKRTQTPDSFDIAHYRAAALDPIREQYSPGADLWEFKTSAE